MSRAAKSPPGRFAVNRRARRDYHVLERFEAGIELVGTEVKSVRQGKIQLKDSYVEVRAGEAYLVNAHISPYTHGNRQNHDPERVRKLLLKKREIRRIADRIAIKGQTCVPLAIYARGRRIKAEVALVRGKKLYDKREAERRRVEEREAAEAVKRMSRRGR